MFEAAMTRVFELARQGQGLVSPNPLVGAVILKGGRIIAEGFHAYYGGPHAEVAAFQALREDCAGATLVVNLEPCCHTKKQTPPCVPQIIERKIARVVIANRDPNPQVNGEGIAQLRAQGVEVIEDVMAEEGEALNEAFFHFMRTGRPFVTLKSAASLDGKTALLSGESQWITGEAARLDAHLGRLRHDAIVIGGETLRKDNPALTVRLPDREVTRQPWRIVVSASGKLPAISQLFCDQHKSRSLVVTQKGVTVDALPPEQVIQLSSVAPFAFEELYAELAKRRIQSLWLEGGAQLHTLFLEARQVQRLVLYLAPMILGQGRPLFDFPLPALKEAVRLNNLQLTQMGEDLRISAYL